MKWIVDTDYSANSQVAIDILLKSKLDIVAFTLTFGVSKHRPIDSKRKLEEDLKKHNADIPVYLGAVQPYINYQKELNDSEILDPYNPSNGSGVVNDGSSVPEVNVEESAALKIIELAKKHGKNLSILCLSSLTNLSLAVLIDATYHEAFEQIYVVGGSSTGLSNSGTVTEANFRADPVAAKNVVLYYPNLTIYPLEIEDSFANQLKKGTNVDFGSHQDYINVMMKEGKSILQILAAFIVINPKIVSNDILMPADVDITGKYTRGALSIEKYPWIESGKYSKSKIAESVDIVEIHNTLQNLKI